MWPQIQAVFPKQMPIERTTMNSWDDDNFVAAVKKHDALTRVRLVKRRARIFRDQFKQSLSPGIVGRMENVFGELLEFFTVHCSHRFHDAVSAVVVDFVDVYEFIEWHRIYSFRCG